MMRAAEPYARNEGATGERPSSSAGRFLPQCGMCPIPVVIVDVFGEQTFQMALIQSNDLNQKVPSTALDPAFCDAVLPRTFKRSPGGPHVEGADRCGNLEPILPIPVEDQKSRGRPKRKGLS